MTLKNAATLALVGALLVAADFIKTVLGILRDLVPAMALVKVIICLAITSIAMSRADNSIGTWKRNCGRHSFIIKERNAGAPTSAFTSGWWIRCRLTLTLGGGVRGW